MDRTYELTAHEPQDDEAWQLAKAFMEARVEWATNLASESARASYGEALRNIVAASVDDPQVTVDVVVNLGTMAGIAVDTLAHATNNSSSDAMHLMLSTVEGRLGEDRPALRLVLPPEE